MRWINRKPRPARKAEQWVEVPLPEGTYADTTKPFSQQDVVNCLKETAEAQGTRSAFKLLGVPGLRPWATVGDGPFRGARNVESKRFVVLGNYLYQFNAAGTQAFQRGYVPGVGLVQMSHNQIAGGHEVAIATGSAGYIWNTVTEEYAKITDASFSGGRSVTFIDQMFVWVDAQGRFFQPSDIAAGTVYTALEEQEAEMAPDKIQCAIAAHQKLYVFGKETLQSYTSTGDPEELFADDKAGINVGCASPHAVALIDNTLIWVDNKGILRRLNGGIAQRISTHPIEKAWAQCDLSKCSVYTWEDVGHAVVYITFTDGMTWGYDCATQRFHRRQSHNMQRCRLNGLVQWDGVWYGGTFNTGEIFELDWDYPLEGCEPLKVRVVPPGLHNGGNRVQVDGVRVQFDTGHPSVTCAHVEPIIPDYPAGSEGEIATGLLDMSHWWPCDGSYENVIAGAFSQLYHYDSPATYTDGVRGQAVMPQSVLTALLTGTGGGTMLADSAFGGWYNNIAETDAERVLFGTNTTENGVGGFMQDMGMSNGGATFFAATNEGSGAEVVTSAVSTGRLFVVANVDVGDRTIDLWIGTDEDAPTLRATTAPSGDPLTEAIYFQIRANTVDVTGNAVDWVDEVFCHRTRKLTPTEILYLWNNGNGRTWPSILEDAGL